MNFTSSAEKRQYVQAMFGRIAHRYDLMNRLMTLGQDVGWRRVMVHAAALPPGGRFLDVATGTGDVAFAALRDEARPRLVIGADFSLPMLHLARMRGGRCTLPRERRPGWTACDTLCLPFASNTFDAVASAFLMRNVTDVAAALREQMRVTRTGGRVLVLDVPRPPPCTPQKACGTVEDRGLPQGGSLRRRIFRLYFHRVVPLLGRIITGEADAYKYLPNSAESFLIPDELTRIMGSLGLSQVRYDLFMMGTIALHVGAKP